MAFAAWAFLALQQASPERADFFQGLEGEWDIQGTFNSGGEPRKVQGVELVERRMDGQWLLIEHRLEQGGAPYRGLCLMSYDPAKKLYTGTWLDGESTSSGSFQGQAKDGVLNLKTTSEKAETRGFQLERWVFERQDEDRRIVRVFGRAAGESESRQVAELRYTRRKAAK